MAENKSKKNEKKKTVQNYREHRNQGDNSLFIGIGIGAILLVLAEIGCILAGIYNMLSRSGSIAVIMTSAFLLLGITGVFLYILRNTLLEKVSEQKRAYEKMLQMNKLMYGKMEERDEKLYKRQLSIAKAQVKRTRESVMNMVRANEYIIDVIEEKLGENSVLMDYGITLAEIQEDIAQLHKLYEEIARDQVSGVEIEPLPEEILRNMDAPEPVVQPEPETEKESPEVVENFQEMEEESEVVGNFLEMEEEPEVVGNFLEMEEESEVVGNFLEMEEEPEIEEDLPEVEEEPEIEEDFLEMEEEPEVEEDIREAEEEPEAEEIEEPEMAPDSNRPMSAEEIAALFNNL